MDGKTVFKGFSPAPGRRGEAREAAVATRPAGRGRYRGGSRPPAGQGVRTTGASARRGLPRPHRGARDGQAWATSVVPRCRVAPPRRGVDRTPERRSALRGSGRA